MKIKERFYLASVVLAAVLAFLLVQNRTTSNETLFAQHQTTESKLPYYEYTGPMEQSPNDHRQHRLIRLPNGMSALCTYDPQAESAAASLTVDVGNMSDPPSFQGMAHFLEHMLFMGSAKYPAEDDYTEFLANHSGSYNAETWADLTRYYFSVDNEAFEGALDRLSWFFVHPLLKPNCVDREVNAVNSEFKSSLRDSGWRYFNVLDSLSNSEHPYSKFNIGNLETLKVAALQANVSLADEVRKFYDIYYSSSIMKLAVVGNHTLDQLTEWAVSKFSAVKDKGDTSLKLDSHPLGPNELGKVIFYETLEDSNDITLEFPVPNTESKYRQLVDEYISVLLSAETSGSLSSYLKEMGWATYFAGYNYNIVNSQLSTFYIQVELAFLGMDHYQDIINAIFSYFQILRETGPQAWLYKELAHIRKLRYQFYERPDELEWVKESSINMLNKNMLPEHVLSYEQNFDVEINAKDISDFLEHLNPSNYRLLVGSQKHKSVELDKQTPFYNVSYHIEQLDSVLTTKQIITNNEMFSFPKPNVFIPENLQMSNTSNMITNSNSISAHPKLLKLTDNLELWFKQDKQFHTPHGAVSITIGPKHLPSTPLESVLGSIYSMCINSVLERELPGVKAGGMEYSVWLGGLSLNIGLNGFKEKMPLLLDMIMHRIANFELKREDYEMHRLKLGKSFSHYQYSDAIDSINMWQWLLTHSPEYHYKEEEHALLNSVTFEKTQKYIANFLNQAFVKMMISGQFTEAEALEMGDKVMQTIDSAHLEKNQLHNVYNVDISPGSYMYSFVMSDENAVNPGVASEIYCGKSSDKRGSAVLKVIHSMLYNQFFEKIRTKEQLGYTAWGILDKQKNGRFSIKFMVQGDYNPLYTKLRIDNFIRGFRSELEALSDGDIQEKISTLSKLFLEKHKSISEEAADNWGRIESGKYNFNAKYKLVEQLRLVTKKDILEAWDRCVNPNTMTENYTRIDYYAWPQKMWSPQSEDLVKYPETILALYGCLEYDGITSGGLADVAEAVALIRTGIDMSESDTDSLAPRLYSLYHDSNSELKSKTALEMAVKQIENSKRWTGTTAIQYKSQNDYHDIGMRKTLEGTWMIRDIDTFKAANGLHPLPESVEKLVPKYSDV